MKKLFKVLFVLAVTGCVLAGTAWAGQGKSLFLSLTSDEVHRAAMAIKFGTRVRTEKAIPVTIFLNVEGVRIADMNIPSPVHVSGKTLREMLKAFMAAGGKVIACPMCMKNVGGMAPADLLEGVVKGSSQVTMPALFADGATVLSY